MKRFTLCLVVFAIAVMLCACHRVHVNEAETVTLVFCNGETAVETQLSEAESKQISEIFNGKTLYQDHPSCGFDRNVSLRVDGTIFCPALDGCCIVKDESSGMYFKITQAERDLIDSIFFAHGGQFPCI